MKRTPKTRWLVYSQMSVISANVDLSGLYLPPVRLVIGSENYLGALDTLTWLGTNTRP